MKTPHGISTTVAAQLGLENFGLVVLPRRDRAAARRMAALAEAREAVDIPPGCDERGLHYICAYDAEARLRTDTISFVADYAAAADTVAGAFAGARARCRWSSEHERALSEGGGGGCHVLCMVLVDVPPAALNAALRALGASLLRALQPFTVSMTLYYSRGYLARRPACGDTVDCSVLEYVSNFSVDVVTARGVRATPFARLLVPGPLAALDVHALPAGVVVDAAPGADVYEASFAPRRSAFGGYFCRQTTPTLRDACVLTVRMPYALCADAVRGGGVAFRRAHSVQVVVAGGAQGECERAAVAQWAACMGVVGHAARVCFPSAAQIAPCEEAD